MRTASDYNKILKLSNHRLYTFSTETRPIYSLVKVSGKGNFVQRIMGADIEETIFSSVDYAKVCKEADAIIRRYGSSRVGV
jgi:hypothetical protein